MGRRTTSKSRLGLLLQGHPQPMYVIAAETHIAFSQLSRYANLIDPIKPHHLRALSEFFDVEPEELIGLADSGQD